MILYYDPVKLYYILAPHHDPTGPFFVPQEALNHHDPTGPFFVPQEALNHHDPTGPLFVPQEALNHHDPTGPLFVPQEALNDDFLLHSSHVPIKVAYFFQKRNELVEIPLDDALVIPHLYKTFHQTIKFYNRQTFVLHFGKQTIQIFPRYY